VAVNQSIPADEEVAIEALMKKGGANKAGSLFRVGISVVNCRVVLEMLPLLSGREGEGAEGEISAGCGGWKGEGGVGSIRKMVR